MFTKLFKNKKEGGGAYTDFSKSYTFRDLILGTGNSSEVRKAVRISDKQEVAVKIVNKTLLSPSDLKSITNEVTILRALNHKNVVRFYDQFEEEDLIYVVMEYVGGGNLLQKIVADDYDFTEESARNIIRTLGETLRYCKEHGVTHRDIKPENLLLSSAEQGGELKLTDFKLSDYQTVNFSFVLTTTGSANYVAPEILSLKACDYKCDIWSLGVIAFLLLSGGYLPFFVEEEGEEGKDLLLQKVRKGRWNFFPPEAWEGVSREAKDFLLHVLEKHPDKRYDYEMLLDHPWLKPDIKFNNKTMM